MPGQSLRQIVEGRSVRRIVIAIEIQIEDSARTGNGSGTGCPRRALVGGIDIAVAVPITVGRLLHNFHLTLRRVDVPLHDIRPEVGRGDHVPVGVLVDVQVALAGYSHHDQLINVLRSVDELLDHVVRAVAHLDDLLPIIIVYLSPIEVGGI